jgi:hypothetical protein
MHTMDRRSLPRRPAREFLGASSAVRWSLGGCAGRLKKGSRSLAAMRPAPPCPPELAVGIWRSPLPHLATVHSAVSSAPNPRLPTPLKSRRAAPLLLRPRARRGRAPGAHRTAVPRSPLPAALSPPTERPNRVPVAPRPYPHPSPAKTPASLAGFYSTAPASRAQDHIAKRNFFPRASLQKVN